VFVKLMRTLDSDLVAIVDSGEEISTTEPIVQRLKENGVHVTEIISADHPLLTEILAESDACVILSLVSNGMVQKHPLGKQLLEKKKIWVTLPLTQDEDDELDVCPTATVDTKLQVINIRQRFVELRSFANYFTRVLINNYDSYPLLASYIQQVFNCSLNNQTSSEKVESCASLSAAKFAAASRSPAQLESIVKLTYAFAVAAKQLTPFAEMCTVPNDRCSYAVIEELLKMNYTFGTSDPPEFRGDQLRFFKGTEGVLMMAGVRLEAVLVEREGRQGLQVYKLLDYETGAEPKVHSFTLPKKIRGIRSVCQPYRSYCGKCERVTRLPDEKAFLSIPKLYPLYLTGIFDFHEGPNCDRLRSDGIAMPLSFVYTMWTFRERYAQLNLLPNVEFGALLVDGCSSTKETMDFVVESENRCYRFTQSDRNITVVPGSTLGESTLHESCI
ncbi:Protein F35H10.10, partial [Aphelenchoides avenae]